MKGRAHIGISGWTYPPWRGGTFYPKGWSQKRELEYASRQVSSIEINGSFYSLQRPSSYRAWHTATPEDFIFSVKGSRFITHLRRLRDVEGALANFFASGILLLKEKLGPLLWQLPPSFHYDEKLLADFFTLLPRDTRAAAALARTHDPFMKADRVWTRADRNRPLRHAMEVRHDSFKHRGFVELLRQHNIALVVADTAGKWPVMEDITSDFIYARLHGDEELYVSGYSDEALAEWARKIRAWQCGSTPTGSALHAPRAKVQNGGRDVFVYFDNDVKVRSPYDAMTLAHRLGTGPAPGDPPDLKHVTETPRTRWPAFRKKRS
ncbi:MAG: DUF72 domain-containing protein [Prosthecobacter sp.]